MLYVISTEDNVCQIFDINFKNYLNNIVSRPSSVRSSNRKNYFNNEDKVPKENNQNNIKVNSVMNKDKKNKKKIIIKIIQYLMIMIQNLYKIFLLIITYTFIH